eukprot:38125_1
MSSEIIDKGPSLSPSLSIPCKYYYTPAMEHNAILTLKKLITHFCTISFCIIILLQSFVFYYYIDHSLKTYHMKWYFRVQFYWMKHIVYACILSLFVLSMFAFLLSIQTRSFNIHHNIVHNHLESRTKTVYIIIIFVILNTIVVLIPLFIDPTASSSTYIFNHGSSICTNVLDCTYCNMVSFYTQVIVPTMFPILYCCICWVVIYFIARTRKRTVSELELDLISRFDSATTTRSNSLFSKKYKKYMMVLLVVSLMISYIWFYFENAIMRHHGMSGWCVVQFVLFISVIKWINKRLARKIDTIRSTQSDYNYDISFELFIEFMFSCMYWTWIRGYIAFHVPLFGQFVFISVIHFVLEVIETNIKFSEIYFMKTEQLLSYMYGKRENKCARLLFRRFKDVSNRVEWRTRLSMDIAIRFYTAISVGLFYCILCGIGGGKDVNVSAIAYLLVLNIVEFIHYVFTFYWCYKNYEENPIDVFTHYAMAIPTSLKVVLLIVFASCFAFIVTRV